MRFIRLIGSHFPADQASLICSSEVRTIATESHFWALPWVSFLMPDRVFSPYYITFFMPDRVFSPYYILAFGLTIHSYFFDAWLGLFSLFYRIVRFFFCFVLSLSLFFVSLLVFPFFLVLFGTFGTLFERLRMSNGFFAVRCHKSIWLLTFLFTPLQTFQLGVRLDILPARVKRKKECSRAAAG